MQPTTGEDFSNINVRPGTGGPNQPGVVYSTPAPTSGRIQFNRNCLLFASIRFLLILFQFAGWVSAAAIPKPNYGPYLPYDFDATRSAYLFFSIVGWILAIAFFVLMIMNIVNWNFFARLPWILLLLVTDALWIVPTFVLAIVCAVREHTVQTSIGLIYVINEGAFGSASAFGFLCTLLYVAGTIIEGLAIFKNGINAKIPAA